MLCFNTVESADHFFIHCPFTVILWSLLQWPLNIAMLSHVNMFDWLRMILFVDDSLRIPKEHQHSFLLQAVVAIDFIWELRSTNREYQRHLDPLAAAQQIRRRHASYENAWSIKQYHSANPLKL